MKLNREQIIKALECCTNCICNHAKTDTECPLVKMDFCKNYLMKQSLALINSQEQRIKELTEQVERVTKQCGEIIVECDERDAERLKQVAELTEKNSNLDDTIACLKIELETERAATVRKMHSMLCEGRVSNDTVVIVANQIAKEMLEGEK